MPKIKVKRSFKKVPPADLSAFGRNVVSKMTGNATFATPDVSLASITAACNTLDTLIAAAIKGSKKSHDDVKAQVLLLNGLLESEAAYVDRIANGDVSKIESAGYQTTSGSKGKKPIPAQANIKQAISTKSGSISIEFTPMKEATAVIALAATNNILNAIADNDINSLNFPPISTNSMISIGFGTAHHIDLGGLQSGTRYDVMLFGFNTNGKGSFSAIMSVQ